MMGMGMVVMVMVTVVEVMVAMVTAAVVTAWVACQEEPWTSPGRAVDELWPSRGPQSVSA